MNLEKLIAEKKGSIVDVRSFAEFNGAHAAESINIPLQELSLRMNELKALPSPLLLCCASGTRSGMAAQLLSKEGIECMNAGSWMDVNYLQAQASLHQK